MNIGDATVVARERLIPWTAPNKLEQNALETPPSSTNVAVAIGERAIATGIPAIWARAARHWASDNAAAERFAEAALSFAPEEAGTLLSAVVEAFEDLLQAPTEMMIFAGEIAAIDDDERVLDLTIEGEETRFVIDSAVVDLGDFSPSEQIFIAGFKDNDDRMRALQLSDLEPDAVAIAQLAVATELKRGALNIVGSLTRRGFSSPAWEHLLRLNVRPKDTAVELSAILKDRSVLAPPNAGRRVIPAILKASDSWWIPTSRTNLLLAALRIPAEEALAAYGQLLAERLAAALPTTNDEAEELHRGLVAHSTALRGTAYLDALRDLIEEEDPRDAAALAELALAEIDDDAVCVALAPGAKELLRDIGSADAEDVDDVAVTGLTELLRVRQLSARSGQPQITALLAQGKLPSRPPSLAEAVVRLWKTVGIPPTPPREFLTLATSASPQAARLALDWFSNQTTSRQLLTAVLRGSAIALGAEIAADPAAIKTMKRHSKVMPLLDQIGVIARYGSTTAAEEIGRRLGFSGSMLRRLFGAARRALPKDIPGATSRFRAAEAWRSSSSTIVQDIAVDNYSRSFDAAPTARAVAVVLASALRFFTNSPPPHVGKLRKAGLTALERVDLASPPDDLPELVAEALTTLRWDVKAERRRLIRLRSEIGF